MQIIRTASLPRSPWKNGGGETVEIAVHPPGAGLATFDWRISMATVASDGPFSLFPGIDRTLSILDGDGIRLTIGDRPAVTLTASSPPLAFAADQSATATLIGSTVTDLNVMSRRGHVTHRVERLKLDGEMPRDASGATIGVFCQSGAIAVAIGGETSMLHANDCAILEPGDTPGTLTSAIPATAFIIRISALPRAAPRPGSPP